MKQPVEPESPEEARIVWPCAADFLKTVSNDIMVAAGMFASQPPQDTDIVFSVLAVANLLKASKKLLGWLGSPFGAWYTSIAACGASAATISMSSAASPEPTPDPAPPSTAT